FTDEGLLHMLEQANIPMLGALRGRKLYKRAFECPAQELSNDIAEWIADDPKLTLEVENALAIEMKMQPGDLLLDYPTKTQMLGLDIPVQRRDKSIRRLTAEGWEGSMNLPKLSEELYRSARWLRAFHPPRAITRPARSRTGCCRGRARPPRQRCRRSSLVGRRVLGAEHVHDDRRDVVESSATIRLRNQRMHFAIRLRARHQQRMD